MILITLGTVKYSFDRIVQEINKLTEKFTKEDFIIQAGKTKGVIERNNTIIKDYLSRKEIEKYYKEARIVISHAGEGSVLQAAVSGVVAPILIPRDSRFGEHVDDQQLKIVGALEMMGMGVVLRSPNKLSLVVKEFDQISKGKSIVFKLSKKRRKMLVNNLRKYCKSI